jgi:hypothetical protein
MITIREAQHDDGPELIALMRSTPMTGAISLRIERSPDFFRLQNLRGQGTVLVATRGHQIVGCVSVTFRFVAVGDAPTALAYVSDLRVHPTFWNTRAALKLILASADCVAAHGGDLSFCIVTDGNRRAFSALLHGKAGTPRFESLGRFLVHQLLPLPFPARDRGYEIDDAGADDLPGVCRFLADFNRPYQFAPLRLEEELRRQRDGGGGSPMRIWVARKDGRIVATLSSFDTRQAKQHIVEGMSAPLRVGLGALRVLLPLFSFPRLGEPVRILYLRHFAFAPGHGRALRALLQHARHDAFRKGYTFLTAGIHERDPLRHLFRRVPRYTVVSHGLVTSLGNDRQTIARLVQGVPIEDFALA